MERLWIPYCGAAPLPEAWLARWNFDPVVLVLLGGAALWAARSADRRWLWLGIGCLALLFVSPLCALTSALFSVRVVHHVVLTAIAAPLLARGLSGLKLPGSAVAWAVVHALTFWLWHAPTPYAFALSSDAAYWLMQLSLLGTALGLWSALRRVEAPLAIVLLLGMMVAMGLLGAILTFAGTPLYAPHWLTTTSWGITPLEDQQLAGLIMWAPAALLYLGAALAVGWRLFTPPVPRAAA